MNAVVTQRLVDLARAVEVAPHGQRTELCRTAAVELGLSLQTIYRKLREVTVNPLASAAPTQARPPSVSKRPT